MRPQLLVGGLMVAAMGIGFYALQIPFVYFWSLPFVIGGAIMMIMGLFVAESQGPPEPPEGFRFCSFCSTPVPLDAERCSHCNGVQPRDK